MSSYRIEYERNIQFKMRETTFLIGNENKSLQTFMITIDSTISHFGYVLVIKAF